MQSLYLLYLDRYHLGDPLFLQGMVKEINQGPPRDCLMVHGSGEKVERTFESQGLFPERNHGVLDVESDADRQLVERAIRELNQEIVGSLTDEVVSTVGIQGSDRGLLRLASSPDPESSDADPGAGTASTGSLAVGRTGWLEALLKQHVIAVVSALAIDETSRTDREIWTADAAMSLYEALQGAFDPIVVFLTNTDQAGLVDAEGVRETASPEEVSNLVAEPAAVERVVHAGCSSILTSPSGLWAESVSSTHLRA